MKYPSGSATDLPHPKDMDSVGRGAGLRLLHCEESETGPKGGRWGEGEGGGGLGGGEEAEGEEAEQQGGRHLAPKGTCKGQVGSPFLQSLSLTDGFLKEQFA